MSAQREDGWYFVQMPGSDTWTAALWDSANEEWRGYRAAPYRSAPTAVGQRIPGDTAPLFAKTKADERPSPAPEPREQDDPDEIYTAQSCIAFMLYVIRSGEELSDDEVAAVQKARDGLNRVRQPKPSPVSATELLRRVLNAVAALGEFDSGKTLFEGSPGKSEKCYAAWMELNNAVAAAKDYLEVEGKDGQ